MPDPTPWIVTLFNMGMECRRCGQSYQPNLPIPIYLYTALSNAFLEAHSDCEEARAELLGEDAHHG